MRFRLPIGLGCTLALVTTVIVACGGASARAGSTPYGPKSSPFAMSKCMRDNGVSNFPDPSAGPGGGVGFNGVGVSNTGVLIVDGIVFDGPVAKKAEKACREFLPPGGPPPAPSASQRAVALAQARCMRQHGVPNFPDPSFGNGDANKAPLSQTLIQSPAFQRAGTDCGGNAHGLRFIGP